jgi:hypothetical protein
VSDRSETQGTFRNGRVELDSAVDWADAARVEVTRLSKSQQPTNGRDGEPAWGMDEGDDQDTPEFRAWLIAQMDSFAPLELTPEEEAEWEASRQWIKDYTIAAVRKQMGL